ncbi:MAG: hypothetical protein KatS3mg031_2997 [Chitinophagales bacterium]|nr:MAG: hypothetical protein KatS3mg031_2926 [Chitinophagales bacterium]GIV35462.1 MAG: hypothetical protein KatS3mg031_2997 [Chitinophagales bacterium]
MAESKFSLNGLNASTSVALGLVITLISASIYLVVTIKSLENKVERFVVKIEYLERKVDVFEASYARREELILRLDAIQRDISNLQKEIEKLK